MSRKSKFKNFLINGEGPNDQDIFKNRLYQLMGYIDLDEKGYFKKQDLVDFVGFEGPIVEDIWSYFIEDQDSSEPKVDFLMFQKGINFMKTSKKPKKGLSRNVSVSALAGKNSTGNAIVSSTHEFQRT